MQKMTKPNPNFPMWRTRQERKCAGKLVIKNEEK